MDQTTLIGIAKTARYCLPASVVLLDSFGTSARDSIGMPDTTSPWLGTPSGVHTDNAAKRTSLGRYYLDHLRGI